MNRKLLILIFTLFIKVLHAETADDVIAKYAAAMGGLDKLRAISTIKMTITMESNGANIVTTIYQKRGNKMRTETSLQGKTAITVFNGTEGWSLNPFSGRETVEKLPADQVKEMKEEADIDGELIDYSKKGYTASLEANEDVDGAEAYHLKLTNDKGDIKHFFIDKETGYLVKEKEKAKMEDGSESESEMVFSNFKAVDGITLPHNMEQKMDYMGQKYTTQLKISGIEINKEMNESLFSMPEVKK